MNYKTDTIKGAYDLIYPEKYMSAKKPVYKSRWEWRVFDKMDRTPHISKWGYECVEIYYPNPLQGRFSIYYPDIFCILNDVNGCEQKYLIEIKPMKMSIAPLQPKTPKSSTAQEGARYRKALQRYQQACMDFAVNRAKWDAAENWCANHGIRWVILTEENSSGLLG